MSAGLLVYFVVVKGNTLRNILLPYFFNIKAVFYVLNLFLFMTVSCLIPMQQVCVSGSILLHLYRISLPPIQGTLMP